MLTTASVSIATPCPPRPGERVIVEIATASDAVAIGCEVLATTNPDVAAMLGAPGFGARLVDVPPSVERVLETMVAFVRLASGTLTGPPARRFARIPVDWPLWIRGAAHGDRAGDVAVGGLFVVRDAPMPCGIELDLAIASDLGEWPIRVRGRVARRLDEPRATRRKLLPGFGVALDIAASPDIDRYRAFVSRAARRAERLVLVVGSPESTEHMRAALRAFGYATLIATHARAVAEASAEADVVVLDRAYEATRSRGLRAQLDARGVPWCDADADDEDGVRAAADALVG